MYQAAQRPAIIISMENAIKRLLLNESIVQLESNAFIPFVSIRENHFYIK